MRIYNYGGVISNNLLPVNLGDIEFVDFFKSFDGTQFDENEKLAISRIIEYLYTKDRDYVLTAKDARIVFIMNKFMVKYPSAKKFNGLNEWLVVYYFLKDFYDKSLPEIDSVIRFFNLYIGKMFAEDDILSGQEIKELVSKYNSVKTALENEEYKKIVPQFVYDEFRDEFVLEGIYAEKYDKFEVEEAFDNLLNAINI